MKNFDEWNEVKKKTEAEPRRFYRVREIWWFRIGLNVGTEQNGKDAFYTRPGLIVKSFGPDSCCIVPLTTSNRKHPFRIPIGKIEEKEAMVNLSQIRTIDAKRLEKKIWLLSINKFSIIKKAIRDLFR